MSRKPSGVGKGGNQVPGHLRNYNRKNLAIRVSTRDGGKSSVGEFYGVSVSAAEVREWELFKARIEIVDKFVRRSMSVGDIVRQFPEMRKEIHMILGLLETEHKIRFTHHVSIPHVEPVPPKERELELARRRANRETLHSTCANSMLFVKSTAEREKYLELGLREAA
jgi:hypothetical protein